jgi:hypothetical protein
LAIAGERGKDDFDCFEEIVGHEVGLAGPQIGVIERLAAVTSQHERASNARVLAKRYIARLIADHKATRQVQASRGGRALFNELGFIFGETRSNMVNGWIPTRRGDEQACA